MNGKLILVNQYGYETDVFDKYREAVRKSNSSAVKVLSIAGVIDAMAMTAFGIFQKMPVSGFYLCMFLLAAGVVGSLISFRKDSSRTGLLVMGYLVSVGFYMLAIYGTVTMRTDAFWIGTQVAVGCFLLDYAWRTLRDENGLGIAIISTSKGIMTDKRAREEHVGGEVLAFIW